MQTFQFLTSCYSFAFYMDMLDLLSSMGLCMELKEKIGSGKIEHNSTSMCMRKHQNSSSEEEISGSFCSLIQFLYDC